MVRRADETGAQSSPRTMWSKQLIGDTNARRSWISIINMSILPISTETGMIPFVEDPIEHPAENPPEHRPKGLAKDPVGSKPVGMVGGPGLDGPGLGESAHKALGEVGKRISAVDRDLGLGRFDRPRARGRYACPCCGEGAKRVMRVRVVSPQHGHSRWMALCAVCAASMLARVPGTIVGGLVRPTRRRRPMRVQAAGVIRQEKQPRFQERGPCYRRAG